MPSANFPIVCIGGSAGGLPAYIRLLRHLPADMGVAIVIVNHLRTVGTMLPKILPNYTQMQVCLITDGMQVLPNRIYIIPEKRDLHVAPAHSSWNPSPSPAAGRMSSPSAWSRLPATGRASSSR